MKWNDFNGAFFSKLSFTFSLPSYTQEGSVTPIEQHGGQHSIHPVNSSSFALPSFFPYMGGRGARVLPVLLIRPGHSISTKRSRCSYMMRFHPFRLTLWIPVFPCHFSMVSGPADFAHSISWILHDTSRITRPRERDPRLPMCCIASHRPSAMSPADGQFLAPLCLHRLVPPFDASKYRGDGQESHGPSSHSGISRSNLSIGPGRLSFEKERHAGVAPDILGSPLL